MFVILLYLSMDMTSRVKIVDDDIWVPLHIIFLGKSIDPSLLSLAKGK